MVGYIQCSMLKCSKRYTTKTKKESKLWRDEYGFPFIFCSSKCFNKFMKFMGKLINKSKITIPK